MRITYGTIWKLAAVVALAAICALFYLKFLRPDHAPNAEGVAQPAPNLIELLKPKAPAPTVDPDFATLSALVDAHSDAIFSPLSGQGPSLPKPEVTALRSKFTAIIKTAPPRGQTAYQSAIQLCDALLLGMEERERSVASLADTRAKPHAAAMSANQKKELEEKKKFFESSIVRRWSENSKTYRAQIVTLRARLQDGQRQITQPSDSKMMAAQPGDTIVLQYPTPVRLKYGSTTLPAGLALRVVGRTSNSVTVDYSGEQVVVPLP